MSTAQAEREQHNHGVAENADAKRLAIALGLILAFMVAEVVTGILAHSLALLSDAAHMLTDAGALTLSLLTLRLVLRPAAGNFTFGLRRMEALSAQANGFTLLVLAALIVYEGVRRLIAPPQPSGLAVLVVAVVGIGVNLLASRQLAKANRRSLNIEGSFQHILTDLFAFIATAIAGAVILATGFVRADGIAALLVAAIMLRSAYGLLKASGRVFLEAAPEGTDVEAIEAAMLSQAGVKSLDHLHVWEIGSSLPSLSAHVFVVPNTDCHAIRRTLAELLHDGFGIEHATLQVDHVESDPEFVALEAIAPRDRLGQA
ncbi:MAG: cation diffusion facilitator family transporter [Gaiellaceae bacterium]